MKDISGERLAAGRAHEPHDRQYGTGWFSPLNVRIASDDLQCFALEIGEFTEQAIKPTRGFLLAKLHKWRPMAQHRFEQCVMPHI
jgi:hypothetical protein